MKSNCVKKHYCESCIHLLEEKGEKISPCSYECLCDLPPDTKISLKCENCGKEISTCPDELLMKKNQVSLVKSAIENPKVKVICFIAPSVRASVTEVFENGRVRNGQGRLITALKKLGFDVVFDMNIGADFTVVEEANEFLERYIQKKNLPMMTSCCPGWVNYVTKAYKEFIPNLSTCKSPQQIFGALINDYYAKSEKCKSTDFFVVSIVPCLAKKLEAKTPGINYSQGFDVDAAITTAEVVSLIKDAGIDWDKLEESKFDDFWGDCSGAGAIFGTTGGVMEAVLRSVGDTLDKEVVKTVTHKLIRGQEGIRKAEIVFGENKIRVAIVSGIGNAKQLLEDIKSGKEEIDFLEVMACPGGCVGGGGQPRHELDKIPFFVKKRAKVLYEYDEKLHDNELMDYYRKAHNSPTITKIYNTYLGGVGGEKAKKMLHRKYEDK